jgi:hypothetical protein
MRQRCDAEPGASTARFEFVVSSRQGAGNKMLRRGVNLDLKVKKNAAPLFTSL